jgi:hypothetical protein
MANQIFAKQERGASLLLLTFIAAFAASTAQALPRPTAASYARGAQITVAGYDSSKSELSGFPVLVRIANDSPSGFDYSQLQSPSDGADLCFIDMDGNGLPFEIDTWNPDGTSLVWVTLPTMEQGTQFVMCWGGATSGKTVCADNPWGAYLNVWHMNEMNVVDSATAGYDGTASGTVALDAAAPVGSGMTFPGNTSSYVSFGSTPNSDLATGTTIECWIKNASGNGCIFQKKEFVQYRYNGGKLRFTTRGVKDVDMSVPPANGTWYHAVVTFAPNGNSSKLILYINGSQAWSGTTSDYKAAEKTKSADMKLGITEWTADPFNGTLDEFRLSSSPLSADWIAATYATQSDPAFLTVGAAEAYEASAAPEVGLVAPPSAVLYTNATLTATVSSLGKNDGMTTDASWVDPLLVVSTNADLSDPLFVLPLSRVSATPASFPVTLVPLATNTTYYAQIQATNSFDVAGESGVVSFTTRAPGAPSGTAIFMDRGFSTMAATATVSDFGVGAVSATARLEASTDGFATVVAGNDVAAILDTQVPLSVSGLAPDTEYALRIRIRNDWGIDTFVALPATHTRDVPFATTGIGWQFSQDGSMIDISFGVSGIYDGATGTATLTYNGVGRGAEGIAAAGTLSWPGIAAADGTVAATVVVTATLEGQTYTKTFAVNVASGSTAVAVTDVTAHTSAATAIRLHAGDVVTLPELVGNERYIVGNKLFGSLEDNILTALRPGILGIHCVGNDCATNTLAVLVLPEKIGNGDIYIFKESSITGNNNGLWCSAASWEKVGAETNDSYPQNPDDIAIIPFYSLDSKSVNLAGNVSVGGLYAGGFRDGKANITLGTNNSNYKREITFRRTDGKSAAVQLCSNSLYRGNNEFRVSFTFSSGLGLIEFASDTILSGGWDGSSPDYPQGRFDFSAKTNSISDNVTVTLREMDTQPTGNSSCTMGLRNLAGGGTFWNRSCATVFVYGDSGAFTGQLRDSGHGAGSTDRTGPTFVRTTTTTNCAGAVVGWVARSGSEPSDDFRLGTGCFQTGGTHSYHVPDPHDPWFTKKGFSMHGGMLRIGSDSRSDWEKPDKRQVDFFSVGGGFNYLHGYNNNSTASIAWFEADSVVHEGTGTLRIRDQSLFESSATNMVTILHGIAAHAVGAGEDPKTSNAASIVPWIVAQAYTKADEDLRFAAFDANDRLSKVVHNKSATLSSYGTNDNAYVFRNGVALSADATFNSLSLVNEDNSKLLGEGRTLTLTSGGLILSDISWLAGASGVGTEDGGAANGFLVLGDATRPAYVWARGRSPAVDKYAPNEIWAEVTAPGGFVAAHTGTLLLGGNQRGIGGEIAVNAGTLILGTAESTCSLATELPIRIFANATLKLPNADSTNGAIVKFDGAAGWFGKVEVPAGVAAKCKKAYWRDYPETKEWQELKRGVYGSSESGAPNVRDDLFVGAGTLQILRDDSAMPFFIMMR